MLAALQVAAADTLPEPRIEVTSEENRYTIHFELATRLSYAATYALVTDYNRLGRINPSIRDSRVVAAPKPGEKHVYSLLQGCVLLFCADLKRVERVRELAGGLIETEILPDQSDFRAGVATWHLMPDGDGTLVRFDAVFEPKRKLLPFIGPWLVRQHLKSELALSAERLRGDALAYD